MPNCIVRHCKNYPSKVAKKDGISYFHFPRDPERCAVWRNIIINSRKKDFILRKNTIICSDHFDEQDIYCTDKGLRRLKKGAVPTLKLKDGYLVPIVNSVPNECDATNGIVIKTEKPDELQSNDGDSVASGRSVNDKCNGLDGFVIKSEEHDEIHVYDGDSVAIISSVNNKCNGANKSVINSKENNDLITPKVSTLMTSAITSCKDCIIDNTRADTLSRNITSCKDIITIRNRRLANLQKQNQRFKKRISYLKNVIKLFKTRENDGSLFHHLSERVEVTELFNALYLKNIKNKVKPFSKYPPAAKLFVSKLHSYSPSAYNYLRKTFHDCLPHQSSFQDWYKNGEAEPEGTNEIQEPLEEKYEGLIDFGEAMAVSNETAMPSYVSQ